MKIRVAPGTNALETMAIDDKLKSLGVEMNPIDRTVDESGAKSSSVKGGIEGLAKAAAIGGDKAALESDELSKVPVGLFKSIGVSNKESKAKAKVDDAIASLESGSAAIRGFVAARSFTASGIAQIFHRIQSMANKVEQVTQPGVIGFTNDAQRAQLRLALASYASDAGAVWSTFAKSVNDEVLPFISSVAKRYNKAADEVAETWGYGPEAQYAAEVAAGTTGETLNYVSRNARAISDVHFSVMNNAELFGAKAR